MRHKRTDHFLIPVNLRRTKKRSRGKPGQNVDKKAWVRNGGSKKGLIIQGGKENAAKKESRLKKEVIVMQRNILKIKTRLHKRFKNQELKHSVLKS